MRIAVGGISTESCTFSTLPTRLSDFVVQRGADLLDSGRYPFLANHRAGNGATFLPTLQASALPGGPVEPVAYNQLKDEFLERLGDAGPLDGLYLDLHGAMFVQGMQDAERDLASAARSVVGPNCLISASMDLHGNISRAFADEIDMLTAYRTAPHEDVIATRHKALSILVRCINDQRRPHVAWVGIPVALPGERTSTAVEPARSLYASLGDADRMPDILDASLFVGYVWADEARTGAAAVVTGFDAAVAEDQAVAIAQQYWDARHQFDLAVESGSIDACIQRGLTAQESTVFISDSGDNPTAGAVGDIPLFVARLMALNVDDAVVAAIADSESVAACRAAGVDNRVAVALGGKLDPAYGPPLAVEGEVSHLVGGDAEAGWQATLQVNGLTVIVTERRKPFTTSEAFLQVGIDPLEHKLVVVKLGYLFPDLARIAPRALMALSPGASDLDIPRLAFKHVRRPLFPLDPAMSWQAASLD